MRRVLADALTKIKGGRRVVYCTLELPGSNPLTDAHAALDTYGFSPRDDLLAQLLGLNLEVARRIEAGGSRYIAPHPGKLPRLGAACH